ncbi:unnamed protein product [Meloidogyne enterolobii]|uniref:Uncharacterized protein n=1 Tax=Meloidogyne enterolobii TaxID=390850 RepID=A0ACB1B433_MELEN
MTLHRSKKNKCLDPDPVLSLVNNYLQHNFCSSHFPHVAALVLLAVFCFDVFPVFLKVLLNVSLLFFSSLGVLFASFFN